MRVTDEALEAEIDAAYDRFVCTEDEAHCRKRWDELVALLAKRSPMRVKRMEKAQGLDKRATFVPRETMRNG